MLDTDRTGADPRRLLTYSELLEAASVRAAPQVATPRRASDGLGLAAGVIGALAIGAVTLVALSNQRSSTAATEVATAAAPVEPVREEIVQAEALPPVALDVAPASEDAPPESADSRAIPMVIDNTAVASAAAPAEGAQTGERTEDANEAFALRAGPQSGGSAQAVRPGNLSATIVQGTMIPAVLETALNSDLPGYTRAIVSRDVRSFDGSAVLIPRGSRLIGQYRSATTPGQSRAFIVWSRLIRPDGVSIELGSPGLDSSGAVGVPGNVDRHVAQRFGSALLLSVVGALPALTGSGSSTVVIGSNSEAQSAAGQALQSDARIAPTIRVPIGTPIQVFTARDLSF